MRLTGCTPDELPPRNINHSPPRRSRVVGFGAAEAPKESTRPPLQICREDSHGRNPPTNDDRFYRKYARMQNRTLDSSFVLPLQMKRTDHTRDQGLHENAPNTMFWAVRVRTKHWIGNGASAWMRRAMDSSTKRASFQDARDSCSSRSNAWEPLRKPNLYRHNIRPRVRSRAQSSLTYFASTYNIENIGENSRGGFISASASALNNERRTRVASGMESDQVIGSFQRPKRPCCRLSA